MPDSSAIDTALLTRLNSDTGAGGVKTLMTDGAYWDVAPEGAKQFVIVSLIETADEHSFGARAFEDATYLVKAVVFSKVTNAATLVRDAAARIDALLDHQPLTATGYEPMALRRTERIRITERDEADPSIVWYHRGGQYEVVMST